MNMSTLQNDILKDRAWDLAVSMFDVTAPNEIIASVADGIYKDMLEGKGTFNPEFPISGCKGTIDGTEVEDALMPDYKPNYSWGEPSDE